METWIPPSLDHLISADQEEAKYRRLIREAAEDGVTHLQGQLVYAGFRFKEYKSGGIRIFAVVHNDKFIVMLFGVHRDKEYIGGTYDGKSRFAVQFNNKQLTDEQEAKNAYAAVGAVYGFNNMDSPLPLFTWD